MADTITTTGVLPEEFETILLSHMLAQPDDEYVLLDSGLIYDATEITGAAGANKGTTFHVDQEEFLAATTDFSEASRRLTEAVDITTVSIPLSEAQYTLTVLEYGGPHDTANTRVAPITLTEKLKRFAKHDQAAYLGKALGRDMRRHFDYVVGEMALKTSNVTLADKAATEGNIAAAKALSTEMLDRLFETLSTRNVPTFPDGTYRLALGERQIRELKSDTDFKAARNAPAGADIGETAFKGTVAVYAGFRILRTHMLPTKKVGAGDAVDGYQGLAWGPTGYVGRINAVAPAPRKGDVTDYGRRESWIWTAYQAWGTLDDVWGERIITT